jgi:hypothetical protein
MDDATNELLRKRNVGRGTLLVAALGVCVAIAALVHLQGGVYGTPARPDVSLQQAILNASRDKAGDASLGLLFDQLNARHFGGRLPSVKVLWEGALAGLDAGDYRQNGMTDGKTILLNAGLKDDHAEVRRTLCHEMVHVKFLAAGQRSTTHDAVFQSELRRIFDDGCFPAVWASSEERASLGGWIDAERTRLDTARSQADAQLAAIKLETDRIERMVAELNERIGRANAAGSGWPSPDETESAERYRTALRDSIAAYNSAVAANESDQARFNEAVTRYNLMMAYPDGLAEDRAKGLIR